jgi:hypothetical protein
MTNFPGGTFNLFQNGFKNRTCDGTGRNPEDLEARINWENDPIIFGGKIFVRKTAKRREKGGNFR